MEDTQDQIYLHQALELAKIRRGFCAPNPSVGAVIVKGSKVIATGYHLGPGQPHAEVDALAKLKNKAKGTTVYVTLEPCCHFGRTPPCTDALIKAGVKRVVYGYRDPNPIVSGKGEAALSEAGILCEYFPLPEINSFYESYTHWHTSQKPFITAKIAMTLDGKIAGKDGERIQITGDALNDFTHFFRKNTDAILTTIKTILKDDPLMNARHQDETTSKKLYILDSQLTMPLNAKVFKSTESITIFHAKNAPPSQQEKLTKLGARCIPIDHAQDGLDLDQAVSAIGKDGIHDLWIESGGQCFTSFINKSLLQRAFIYIAPRWLGEGISAFSQPFDFRSEQIHWEQLGHDVLCEIHW